MRTAEDLKLALALLQKNVFTSSRHGQIVSCTAVFQCWVNAGDGEFLRQVREKVALPSHLADFDELLFALADIVLNDASKKIRSILDAHAGRAGKVKMVVRQQHFRRLLFTALDLPLQILEPKTRSLDCHDVIRPQIIPRPSAGQISIGHDNLARAGSCTGNTHATGFAAAKASESEATERFTRHLLHFGTDRRLTLEHGAIEFGDERGHDRVTYGVAHVSVPHVHAEGKIERPPSRWKFWHSCKQNPDKHIAIHYLQAMDLRDWIGSASSDVEQQDGLLFIHGFNVDFNEAIWRTAQICHDLQFSGVKLCYSWASHGKVLKYPSDEATVDWSTAHLRTFLQEVTEKLGLRKLHIIAHSMGNRALLSVLESWRGRAGSTPIGQVVLAAPDIDTGRFMQIAKVFGNYEQVTLYASRSDRAIKISRELRKMSRAGDALPPIVDENLATIDVTSAGSELFGLGHSYVATKSKVFRDLYCIIKEGLKPDKRSGIVLDKLGYYVLS
ncbi:alpha/beta hydrolase [Pseudomonas sp. LRF_L74]|uniref:alpha/beta hydrolase n=1 Tax=Pseudomonas sp. LRF_L74 TaxID=3369422 RepID=UPI003F61F80B